MKAVKYEAISTDYFVPLYIRPLTISSQSGYRLKASFRSSSLIGEIPKRTAKGWKKDGKRI